MNKGIKYLSTISAALFLATTGSGLVNEAVANPTNVVEVQAAAETNSITLPKGYTASAILNANNNPKANKKSLINACKQGMINNKFYGNDADKGVMVNVTNLTWSQKEEISNFALSLINSARRQMGKQAWTLSTPAMHFADQVAKQYHDNGRSVWDSDHYVAGIERAAAKSGLNSKAGQVYEDETGLPITSQYSSNTRSMYALKEQIYYNVKQMLFGGYYGTDSQVNDSSRYTEWEHAGDLLGLRSLKGYDAHTKYFGLSFSDLPNNHSRISCHFIGVAPIYIQNKRAFN